MFGLKTLKQGRTGGIASRKQPREENIKFLIELFIQSTELNSLDKYSNYLINILLFKYSNLTY